MSKKKYSLIVSKYNFKWNENAAVWASVYIGSNDFIYHFNEIVKQLKAFKKEEIELITVIGGMQFLKLLEYIDFKRVTLFDININEFSKFILVNKYIQQTDFQNYDLLKSVNHEIVSNPDSFYLASKICDEVQIRLDSRFRKEESPHLARGFSIFDPEQHNQYVWRPAEKTYNKVKMSLATDLNPNLYLGFPQIDARGRIVVVYLSCIVSINPWILTRYIKNPSIILPIYTTYRGTFGSSLPDVFCIRAKNKVVLDAHVYWQYMVDRYKFGTSLHIRGPEDRKKVGRSVDKPFTKGIWSEKFLNSGFHKNYDTIIIHIIFGRAKTSVESRIELFNAILTKAKELGKRIIITEHNKKSGHFDHLKNLPEPEELIDLAQNILEPDFNIVDIRDVPGFGAANRNLQIVADKKDCIELEEWHRIVKTEGFHPNQDFYQEFKNMSRLEQLKTLIVDSFFKLKDIVKGRV